MPRRLNKVWSKQVFFTLAEHGGVRVLDAVITFVLIRLMSAEHFGLFSVYQSWVMMLLFFLPSIEFVLFREYAKLKREGRLAAELRLYRFFNFAKLGVVVAMALTLSLIPQEQPWLARLSLLAFALALPFSQSFFSFLREPLRFEMQQATVAALSLLQRLLLLAAMWFAAKTRPGDVPFFIGSALATYLAAGVVWSIAARPYFKATDHLPSHPFKRLSTIFFSVVIWVHINGVITQTVQTFDVFCLSLFKVDLTEIALYGIALKAANFFQILPIALASSFGIFLARHHGEQTEKQERRTVLKFTSYFVALGAVLFAFGMLVGEPLLAFLAKGKLEPGALARTLDYFKWQLAGVVILTSSYPMGTYVSARSSLPRSVAHIALPWAAFSAGLYLWAASQGAATAARANVAVYAAFVALLVWFWRKN